MKITIWGARGTLPTPHPQSMGFGGNTSCLELSEPASDLVILDAGSGIRELGEHLSREASPDALTIHLFLTHFHWDHIMGIPVFAPFFNPANSVTIYSSKHCAPLREALSGLMISPYYPIPFDSLPAQIRLVELDFEDIRIGSISLRPFPVHHPQEACGYRIESSTGVAVFIPDHEAGDSKVDQAIAEQARGADVLFHDAQYQPEEYKIKAGWGHSTWEHAVAAAQAAAVKRLILFHHDPSHTDDIVSGMEANARERFPDTFAARERWSIEI